MGASPKQSTFGWMSYRALADSGFNGDIHLINPRYDEIDERPCLPNLAAIEKPVDHAMLNVANARVEAVLDDAIAAGIPAVTIFSSGYLENDTDPPLLVRLRTKAQGAGLMVCGGNGSGFVNYDEGTQVTLASGNASKDPGSITLISQSGSIYGGLVQNDGRLKFNLTITAGQEIATTTADYMDYALELPSTRAIALYIETIRDPAGFCAAADKAKAQGVPVVALKAARTEESVKMAMSHSGALAGDDAAYDAIFERHGVIRVYDLPEMIATLQMATQPRPFGAGGLVAITDSGGEREHLVDQASDAGLRFAEISPTTTAALADRLEYGLDPVNPLDAWGTGHDYVSIFLDCWRALMSDPDCAAGAWIADMRDGEEFRGSFVEGAHAIARETGKPMAFVNCVPGGVVHETVAMLEGTGIRFLDGMGAGMKAMAAMMVWRDHLAPASMVVPVAPESAVIEHWRARLGSGAPLDEAEGLALAGDFGIAVPEMAIVEDRAAVLAAADKMGGPVVLKTAEAGIQHKSDVGGVHLGLMGADAVGQAYDDMAERLGPRCLVAPMAPAGTEMVFGLIQDPQFGPLVLVGTGGIFVEVLKDSLLAVPPFDIAFARSLIDRLKGRALLDGVRGRPAADIDALADMLARFSVLAATLGATISELDLNPVIAGPDGALAVDALVVPQQTT
ncbi:MAG: CoA-binding protein [Rhodospirillaceae bacterium]|nr:CoA-binding protein [Rhodospirillaceae bacterium]MBT6205558.1 CoA-binding protein [Rhodospirillaceae bacterium]MBT6511727.1 CoA-binding protein [Rhodospirillaceae bacterium]MBT7614390.1 CoA-binding protein [Rhodospirillaceae bacterium]